MNSVVTEDDRNIHDIEDERVRADLRTCGYPEWAMNKVKEQMTNKNQVKAAKKPNLCLRKSKVKAWLSFLM